MTKLTRICIVFIAAVVLLAFALMVYAASADTPSNVYLPALRQPEEYPQAGWVITARWGNQAQTFFTLTHPGGWEVTGVCMDPQYPAPNVGDTCTLVNGTFYCIGSTQRIAIVVPVITPTATATATATATSTATPTELPTETPEPTLHPPTGITDTPTPGLP